MDMATTSLIDSIVDRLGGCSAAARQLSQLSGERITKQRVWNWKNRRTLPKRMIVHVHAVTRIPMKDLLAISDME
jgi:hypothetical protein